MKILFSPFYDGGVYLENTECLMGVKAVGLQGLLAELELRAGIVGNTLSRQERAAYYMTAIKDAGTGTRFYEKSFEKDGPGVAAELLLWRDSLVMAGWNSKMRGISKKLDDIADIEEKFKNIGTAAGEADRWVALSATLNGECAAMPVDMEISVRMKAEFLPPVVAVVLEKLKNKGVNVTYDCHAEGALEKMVEEGRIKVRGFHDIYDNCEWAALNSENYDLLVAGDSTLLNSYLYSSGKHCIDSSNSAANPPVLQLFKLGMSLFVRPLNVVNLVSYLSLPVHPMAGNLRKELVGILLDEKGFGPKWTETLDGYKYKKYVGKGIDGEPDEKKTKEKRIFIDAAFSDQKEESVNRDDVLRYNDALKDWANKYAHMGDCPEDIAVQLETLKRCCSTLDILLQGESEEIKTLDFANIVKFIYSPMPQTTSRAVQGAADCVPDIRMISGPVKNVLWVNCSGLNSANYEYHFLNDGERNALGKYGVVIPAKENPAYADSVALGLALADIKGTLDITIPKYGPDGMTEEAPVVTKLRKLLKKDAESEYKIPEENVDSDAPEIENCREPNHKKEFYELANGIDVDKLQRDEESYSSLDSLIQYPFEYVLNYYAHLKEKSIDEMRQISKIQGIVAHKYIELLFEEADTNIEKFKELNNNKFNEYFDSAINGNGVILLMPEYKQDYLRLKNQLKKSVENLAVVMQNNGLTFEATEREHHISYENVKGFDAKVDLLLTDRNKRIYIVDLKWSKEKKYTEILERSEDLQLAIYKKVVESSENSSVVAAAGYFILTSGTLLVPDEYKDQFSNSLNIKFVKRKEPAPNHQELFARAMNSYVYRMNELKSGRIEDAEDMIYDGLQYVANQEDQKLFTLKNGYGPEKKDNKSTVYGNPNKILKGDLK